ncbi:MAG: diguanylate cyclase [Sulfurimonas sp. RIFCSPHIGHO2_12_FULL_36_9]|uniref:diguanylate cyclase n=1 Tax=Sulfurimonas sp. RIFCSPLOWO2_12_36_12 TaxID=1802253 RepID=UPI0008CE22AB|nr:diguanylate cyclase [Sulfurimonas sp. RIFCSPLOWO2_12_36_12]OHD96275.1 MAG: diguanylate cyclase [Sulfurimonas sp. RIFCSPHIGHO2_12_FULL_36_9]OHD98216.1 MAG: diguanylate cyclase [Sulfurimonas sp. RIFCSPLOWO2_02_FULL_36_28]OHE01898.1 MAG: diguanylate cyclase [Sulfurimonas sp. RIFCSPLOWO2_12_36_12]OHE06686.1 MAG: diguanylate cyclase [Sulfurimonas sp. RIFCSPLOWO2_12_FULL_36_74]
MKHSIKKIFKNLSLFLISATIFAAFGVLAAIDHTNSYIKLDNLSNQKKIISSITNLPKENLEISLIQLNGKTTQLINDIDKLRSLYEYSFTEKLLLLNSEEYFGDLDKLNSLTKTFNNKAIDYYNNKYGDIELKESELKQSIVLLNEHINSIIFKAVTYNQATFSIHKKVTYFAFIIILLASIWYRKRLNAIYKDLEFLNNANLKRYDVFSEEADAISLRIKRKPVVAENPAMLDAVTGISNLKGMMNSYAEKKGMKDNNFTAVTVFEVDNFSKTNKVYSLEFTQTILKKIAFSISLHQQVTDVIARTEYNQFTIIFSRSNKEQLFKEVDAIRQSISELKLSSPELGEITITLSGGYVIKPNNVSLEESIRQAKKVLKHAQNSGGNIISQIKDLAHSEL